MNMSPVVKDFHLLRQLLSKATGLKVYKSYIETSKFSVFNVYRGIVQEYKDENNPHITVAQGSWSITDGGEYKVSLYSPSIIVGNKTLLNYRFVRNMADRIVNALNEQFGEECWSTCNEERRIWKPMSRNSFYLQIPNFEKYK